MQLDPLRTTTTVDSKTAEEALALAIRLQQARGDRVSIDELQRTADEAGIDRVYLESALHQVSQKQVAKEQGTAFQRIRIIPFVVAIVGAVFALSLVNMDGHNIPPPFYIAIVAAWFAVSRVRRRSCRSVRRRFRD